LVIRSPWRRLVDRLVHHAEVIVLKGDSFRLRGKRQEVLTGEKER
jgi:DNA replication protein DnaC